MVLPEINYIEDGNINSKDILPSKTFRIMLEDNRLGEKIDDVDAISQSLLLNIMTERGGYVIFNRDYGLQLYDLIGKSLEFIKAILPSRIRECLLLDDRVSSVDSIDISQEGKKVYVVIELSTIYTQNILLKTYYNFEGS